MMTSIKLRSRPLKLLTEIDLKLVLRKYDFFESTWNENGKGIQHQYELVQNSGQKFVIDYTTGLLWQRSGSKDTLKYIGARAHIVGLNRSKFGGFDDWRLPTVEEALSLIEPHKTDHVYVNSMFDHTQTEIWTSDRNGGDSWIVNLEESHCISDSFTESYVRGVRSLYSQPTLSEKFRMQLKKIIDNIIYPPLGDDYYNR